MNTETTPGYNRRIAIAFSYDKRGRKVAYSVDVRNARNNRMPVADALLFVAAGQADEVTYAKRGGWAA